MNTEKHTMQAIDALETDDILNMYLVMHDVKPATLVAFSPSQPFIGITTFGVATSPGKQRIIHRTMVDPVVVADFKAYLDGLELPYHFRNMECGWDEEQNDGRLVVHNRFTYPQFYIGSNPINLERVVAALGDDHKLGLAFGFPEEAVAAFGKVVDGERRDGSYFTVCLARAKRAGIPLPSWLAYISFVPELLDIVNGRISKSSETLGRKYQDFVRRTNPTLADDIESHFLNDNVIPISWEKQSDDSYALGYGDYKLVRE